MQLQDSFTCKNNTDKPSFEIWFAVVMDEVEKRALWIRYTKFIPKPHTNLQPTFSVWASYFDNENPTNHFASAKSYNLNKMPNEQRYTKDILSGFLCKSSKSIEWNMEIKSKFKPVSHLPEFMLNGNVAKTKTITLAPFGKANESVKINGKIVEFNNANAIYMHIWGTSRVQQLYWSYIPEFDDNDWGVEIVRVKIKSYLIPLTFCTLRHKNKLIHDKSFIKVLSGKCHVDYPKLLFLKKIGKYHIELNSELNQNQNTSYLYKNPNDINFYINQSDISNAQMILTQNKEKIILNATHSAAVEFHLTKPFIEKDKYINPYWSKNGS